MVLMYLDFSPVPSQMELASEMHTDINHTTEWRYAHIPFENRGFSHYYDQSLSEDFNTALTNLKGDVSQNLPVIMHGWYDQKAKNNGTMTHARVITGYNSTGVFFHDPWSGPNRFLNNSDLCSLWKTDLGYWALIIKSQPTFDLTVEIKDILGLPVSGIEVTLWNGLNHTKLTGANGTVSFYRLSVSERVLRYRWRFESNEDQVTITKPTTECYLIVFSDRSIVALTIAAMIVTLLIGLASWNHRRSGYARIWR